MHTQSLASLLIGIAFVGIGGCGASGSDPQLDRSRDIGPSAVCALGGTVVDTGPDRNHNGVLDDDEVTHSTPVCNASGPATLLRIDAEPPGARCQSGGERIRTGPDRNRNGALDDDEITSTTYACNASDVFIGDFTAEMWNDPAEVSALTQALVVTGTLTVASDAPASLPRLTMVGGLTIAPGAPPASLDLPALTQITGSVIAIASELDALALPALTTVGGSVRIATAPSLGPLSLPALTQVGALSLEDMPALPAVELPALTTVSSVSVVRTGATRVSLPAPAALGSVTIDGNAKLVELALPGLARASQIRITNDLALHQLDVGSRVATSGSASTLGSLDIELTGLEAIDLPISTASQIVIANNRALASLQLASLTVTRELSVRRCPALATLAVPRLFEVDDLTLTGPLTSLALSPSLLVHHQAAYVAIGLAHLPPVRLERGASLWIAANPALVDLRGLDLPAEVGSVMIWSNPLLTSLTGLESVAQMDVLQALDNAALIDLTGLGSLVQAGTIELRANAAMTGLRGLERLSSLGNYLSIMDEPALTSLDGLDALENIGGALLVTRDPVLASLDGLAALQSVGLAYGTVNGGPSFFITDDPALSPAAITALLARIRHN